MTPTTLDEVAERSGTFYEPFDLTRPPKPGIRHIDNPTRDLKSIQRRILSEILDRFPLPAEMTGGVPGRSTRDHASRHVGQEMLVTLDLRRCFPNTSWKRVFNVFRSLLRCGTRVASILTKLTTFQRHLPQGAPTSSFLCNLTLMEMHRDLRCLAEENGLNFSIYVDDIALSGPSAQRWIDEAIRIVQRHGHHVGRKKILKRSQAQSQVLVGLSTNRKVAVTAEFRRKLRARVLELVESPGVMNWELVEVWARIRYVRGVDEVQGAALEAFADRYLPRDGAAGDKPIIEIRTPCRGLSRHRIC